MIDKLAYAKAEAKEQRTKKAIALKEVRLLKAKLKTAENALTFYGEHAIVDRDCGYTARRALQVIRDEDNGE